LIHRLASGLESSIHATLLVLVALLIHSKIKQWDRSRVIDKEIHGVLEPYS